MSHSSTLFLAQGRSQSGPDPRFQARLAVRMAIGETRQGNDGGEGLRRSYQEWPQLVEAVLERERDDNPVIVAKLREKLGLEANPWAPRAREAVAAYSRLGDAAEKLRFAADQLLGDIPMLPPLAAAIAAAPGSAELVSAMHCVSPAGEKRAQLARMVLGNRKNPLPKPPFFLNRETWSWHMGFMDENLLVIVFREYPGHYSLFSLRLGLGVRTVRILPLATEARLRQLLDSRNPGFVEMSSIDDCRTQVAAAISQLQQAEIGGDWRSLGHLVEERLFPDQGAGAGFVLGDSEARYLLDQLARVLLNKDMRVEELVYPGSAAAVLAELYGGEIIRGVLGITHGVERLDIGMEQIGQRAARAVAVGRSERDQVLSRTRFSMVHDGKRWTIDRIQALGVGPRDEMYGPIWDEITGHRPRPIKNYNRLPEHEQELLAGLLDTGFRVDQAAAALSMARNARLEGTPGSLAAAYHSTYQRLIDDLPENPEQNIAQQIESLCERYEGQVDETCELVNQLETQLIRHQQFARYILL